MSTYNLFTSESVSAGHPDKICDQISDAVRTHFVNQSEHPQMILVTKITAMATAADCGEGRS